MEKKETKSLSQADESVGGQHTLSPSFLPRDSKKTCFGRLLDERLLLVLATKSMYNGRRKENNSGSILNPN
jgi:hypothetical protein